MAYYSNCGPESGAIRLRTVPGVIGVLQDPGNGTPIGMAMAVGDDEQEVAVWKLTVHGIEVPGLWVVIDREFRPAS